MTRKILTLRTSDGKLKKVQLTFERVLYLADAMTMRELLWRLGILAGATLADIDSQPPKTKEWLERFIRYFQYIEQNYQVFPGGVER